MTLINIRQKTITKIFLKDPTEVEVPLGVSSENVTEINGPIQGTSTQAPIQKKSSGEKDKFNFFTMNVAQQLRKLPLQRALKCQLRL